MLPDGMWRIIHHKLHEPYLNLAYDEAILQALKEDPNIPNTITIWRSDRCVVVGRFQSVSTEIDEEACREFGVKIGRRCSGGGSVYHDLGNINWSIYLRSEGSSIPYLNLFERIGSFLSRQLRQVGLDAFHRGRAVFVNGKKVSGMAAYAKPPVLLLHGTLLVESDQRTLNKVLRNGTNQSIGKYTRSKWAPTTNLIHEMKRKMITESWTNLVFTAITGCFQTEAEKVDISQTEIDLAWQLREEKYCQPSWIFCIP